MTLFSKYRAVLFPIITGLLYYLGAYVGVHFAALESGIVVLWPPNAVLLAALLSQPPRSWWPLVLMVMVAEVLADVPVFTVTQALLFGAINITECMVAAGLIRYWISGDLDWNEPRDVSIFLVTAFFIAAPLAAVGGASVYTFLLTSDTAFLTFWRLWWIGDATGLVILTPFLHMLFSTGLKVRGASLVWPVQPEMAAAWVFGLVACFLVFSWNLHSEAYMVLTPLVVLVAPIWVAIRFGPFAASFMATAIALYAAFATAAGAGPFIQGDQDQSALLAQEFVVLFTVLVLYVAAFVHQDRRKSHELRRALSEVRQLNEVLEERVQLRTRELFQANERLQLLAMTDELTGIPNRRHMKSLGEEEVRRSQRSQRPFAVMLLDIDYFKQVNDRYGHAIGDLSLKAFADAIASSLRSVDRFGRWGGEEFMIIVPDSDQVDLSYLSEKLLECIREVSVPVDDHRHNLTASIGVAEWHGASFDKLVSGADDALYRAKEKGRDRVEFNPCCLEAAGKGV
ncbi:MAG: diguanylate cyclase [Marinobacter sp.]|nr:diguanylate cyclase [Marinobacter sp.]